LRCKVTGFPPVPAAAPEAPSAAAVVPVVLVAAVVDVVAAAAAAGFMRLESESSVDISPSSRDLFDAAPMIATPAVPPAVEPAPAEP